MVVFLRRTIVAVGLLLLVGCVTEELVVFEEGVVKKGAMKPFLGTHQVEQWPGDTKPTSIEVTEKDGEFSFSYAVGDQKIHLKFMLSKIPGSKKKLQLLSIPAQEDTNQANMFFIVKAGKDQTYIWPVFSSLPVAKDHLEFEDGKAKAEDVKTFLTKHADAFVTANEPPVTLKHRKR